MGVRGVENPNSIGERIHQTKYKNSARSGGCAARPPGAHTVVSIVSITSRSDCDGERRVHSSGSQLLSGL